MESQKLCILVLLVTFRVLSFVSSEPQEHTVHKDDAKETEALNEDNQKEEVAEENADNVCRTDACKGRANLINSYLNDSVNPCDNFYSYVCDKWTSNHKDRGSSDSFKMMRLQYEALLTDILEIESKEPTYSSQEVTNKAGILFKTCIASKTKNEIEALLEIMRRSNLAEWPMTTEMENNKKKFNNASDVLLLVGISPLIHFFVTRNSSSQDTHGIEIFPLGLQTFTEDQIKRIVKYMKPNITNNDLESVIKTFTNLENKWVPLKATAEEKMETATRSIVTTIDSLEKQFTRIPLYTLLSKDFAKAPKVNVERNELVEVPRLAVYEAINELLAIADAAGLYNYMGLQLVLRWITRIPPQVEDVQLRKKYCVGLVYRAMKEVVSHIYAMKHFPFVAKMEVETIVRKIKGAFQKAINSTKWMDEATKEKAQNKLTEMVAKVGYPSWLLNTTILENLYEYVPALYPNITFSEMLYLIDENTERKKIEMLRQPYVPDTEWFFSESLVNAFFIGRRNQFVYPLGGLQRPFYEFGLPWALNFGGVGTVIGHEITHAFTGRASPFSENTEEEKYKEAAECFQYQYGNTTDEETGMMLNGITTLNENMADNSGLQIALKAYQDMIADDCDNTTTSLEGLDGMTGLRLFFIAYGMSWCNVRSQEELKEKITRDSHSPNRYRVNFPVYNLEAFAIAFNCSKKSPVTKNFTRTCTLW